MLLAMAYVCNYRCSTCILTKIIHLHTPNHRFHNKSNPISMVLYVTLDNLLIQWYNVNMVVKRFENCQNRLLNGKMYSNEMLMKTPDPCRIPLKEMCNLDDSLRKCMNVLMKKTLVSLNYPFCSTICRNCKYQCQSALMNMLYMCTSLMTSQYDSTMPKFLPFDTVEFIFRFVAFPKLVSAKCKSICMSKMNGAFWNHFRHINKHKSNECHSKTKTYLESFSLEVTFCTIKSIFNWLVIPKIVETKKYFTKKHKYLELSNAIQNEALHKLKRAPITSACNLSKLTTSQV